MRTKQEDPALYRARYLKKRLKHLGHDEITVTGIMEAMAAHNTCRYCKKNLLVAYDYSIDHGIPLGRGGDNNLGNLDFDVCMACNKVKGKLTGPEFSSFMQWLSTQNSEVYKELYTRLRMAGFRWGR